MVYGPKWEALRSTGIGGSDAAAALGVSRWKTPYRLWMEKTKQVPQEDIGGEPVVHWGLILEPIVLREYAARTGNLIKRRDMRRSRRRPWMVANIDSHVVPATLKRIVEAKTINPFAFFNSEEWGKDGSAEIPVEYYAQCQHNMIVSGAVQCDLPVLIGGHDFRIYYIPYDQTFCDRLIAAEANFWIAVQTMKEPEAIDVSDIMLKFPQSAPGKIVEANETTARAYSVWVKHDRIVSFHDKICTKQIDRMKMFMKDAEQLTVNGVKAATWKTGKSGTRRFCGVRPVDVEAEQPDAQATGGRKKRGGVDIAAAESESAAAAHSND